MNIFILLSLVVSACKVLPLTAATSSTEKFGWVYYNNLFNNYLKENTRPTPSSDLEKLPQKDKDTSFVPDSEYTDELIKRIMEDDVPTPATSSPQLSSTSILEASTPLYFSKSHPTTEPVSQTLLVSQTEVSSNHETSTPLSFSKSLPTTRPISPPLPVSQTELFSNHETFTPLSFSKSLPASRPVSLSQPVSQTKLSSNHETSNSLYFSKSHSKTRPISQAPPLPVTQKKPHMTSSSNNNVGFLYPWQFSYSQPLSPQQHELPLEFYYIQHSPVPFNPSYFYNQQDWTPPVSPRNVYYPPFYPYHPHSHRISSHNVYYPPYYPHSHRTGKFPTHSLHPIPNRSPKIPNAFREQSQYHLPQFSFSSLKENIAADVKHPLQSYGLPDNIYTSSVHSYIRQHQFQPAQPLVNQPPTVYLQPSGLNYNSQPFQPVQMYSNQPSFTSMPTASRKVSASYPSSPIESSAPFTYYTEPRTSISLDRSNLPLHFFGGSQQPIYVNPSNLNFL